MNEEEARTKWCPMMGVDHSEECCIGSTCMMWRWNSEFTLPEGHVLPDIKDSATEGYCGLGGKP
jgi:hypothetical protein